MKSMLRYMVRIVSGGEDFCICECMLSIAFENQSFQEQLIYVNEDKSLAQWSVVPARV